jgi:hypothetical protein
MSLLLIRIMAKKGKNKRKSLLIIVVAIILLFLFVSLLLSKGSSPISLGCSQEKALQAAKEIVQDKEHTYFTWDQIKDIAIEQRTARLDPQQKYREYHQVSYDNASEAVKQRLEERSVYNIVFTLKTPHAKEATDKYHVRILLDDKNCSFLQTTYGPMPQTIEGAVTISQSDWPQ